MRAYAHEAAKLVANNWRDATINITGHSNHESDDNCANFNLAEFGIYTKTLLASSIKETCHR